jgi:hypothetical protein
MSFLTYNGIQLELVRTVRFDRQAIYDEDSTTYLWSRFLVEVDTIYNPMATSYQVGNPPTQITGVNPAVTDDAIRHVLMVPRKQLLFTVGGDTLLRSPEAPYTVDAHNGPIPISVNIQAIHGSKSFRVRYVIETFLLECPSPEGPALVSHRWTESHEVDDNYFTVRMLRGRAKFRSDLLLNGGVVPDDFRASLIVGIPYNFKRQRIAVTASSDGTELLYELLDQEVYQSLGAQQSVTKCEAWYGYRSLMGGGALTENMLVRVWGRPRSSRNDLFTFAMKVLLARIDPASKTRIVREFAATEDLFNAFIEVNAVTMGGNSNTDASGNFIAPPSLFAQPGIGTLISAAELINPVPPGDGVSRGDYTARVVAAALASPCGQVDQPPTTAKEETAQGVSLESSPIITVSVQTTLPVETNYFSTSNTLAFYNSYYVDVKYERQQHRLQVPVGGPGPTNAQFIDVAAPTTRKIVAGTAERIGLPPDLPVPDTGDANEILLYDEVMPVAPELLPDGKHYVFRQSFKYVFGLKTAKGAGSQLSTAAVPFALATPSQNVLQSSSFVDGIIGTGGSSTLRTP